MKSCKRCAQRNVCVKVCAEVEARLPKDYTGKDPKRELCMDPAHVEVFARKDSYARWSESERSAARLLPDLSVLTAKEKNALLLIARGMSMRAAARRLRINLNALQCRVASARRKLGAGQFPYTTKGGVKPARRPKGGAR